MLISVSVFVVLSSFVDVGLAVFQHAIDQARESVGHGGNGFGGAEFTPQLQTETTNLENRETRRTLQKDSGPLPRSIVVLSLLGSNALGPKAPRTHNPLH